MKRNLLFACLLGLTIVIFALLTATLVSLFSDTRNIEEKLVTVKKEELEFGIVSLESIAEKLTLEQLIERLRLFNTTIYLPFWMPSALRLTMIYYKPPIVVLVYSDRGVTDLDYCNASIEISLMRYQKFHKEELEQVARQDNKTELAYINDNWVMLIEGAKSGRYWLKEPYNIANIAYLVLDDQHYYLLGVTPPLNVEDLVNIIWSMRPIEQYLSITGDI